MCILLELKIFFGVQQILSKDSRPNFRDLYKQKGKKLSDSQEQSKQETKEKLESKVSFLSNQKDHSPQLRDKLLKLHIKTPNSTDTFSQSSYSFRSNKQAVYSIFLSFGRNFQRVIGSPISTVHQLYDQFLLTNPNIKDFTEHDCQTSLNYLHNQGLIYQLTPTILFEPLEQSQDINSVFSLLSSTDHSLSISTIEKRLSNWSSDKIHHILDILVDNGLAILDGETVWFPQLE